MAILEGEAENPRLYISLFGDLTAGSIHFFVVSKDILHKAKTHTFGMTRFKFFLRFYIYYLEVWYCTVSCTVGLPRPGRRAWSTTAPFNLHSVVWNFHVNSLQNMFSFLPSAILFVYTFNVNGQI